MPPQHAPHSRHRAELRERAFELHCQLQSTGAIAAALGVPERTVRSWIKAIVSETTQNLKKRRVGFLRDAVVAQQNIAGGAWNAFNLALERERARLASDAPAPAPLSRVGKRVGGLGSDVPAFNRPARLLSIALAAQREIDRLLRLYDKDIARNTVTRGPLRTQPALLDDLIDGLIDDLLGDESDPHHRPDDRNHDDDPPGEDLRARPGCPPKPVYASSAPPSRHVASPCPREDGGPRGADPPQPSAHSHVGEGLGEGPTSPKN